MPRTQTNKKDKNKKEGNKLRNISTPPIKIKTNKKDINKILVYSASIIKANPPLLYSVLYPDTSSDSPSAKSNGVRLVSARQEINQIKEFKGNKKINHIVSCTMEKSNHSNLALTRRGEINTKTKLTSYEIV